MKILLTGASGFAGGEVLRQALEDSAVEQVTALTRCPLDSTHPKLRQVVLDDFLAYGGLDLRGYRACIWCLGVSQARVSPDAYVQITLHFAVAAATAMFAASPGLRFCFVSGRSADPTEASPALFARIKGRTERSLADLGGQVVCFRPGYIRPTSRSTPRRDLGRLFAPVGALIDLFSDDFSVDCDQLARCLLDVAKNGSEQTVLSNPVIRNWKPRPAEVPRPWLARAEGIE